MAGKKEVVKVVKLQVTAGAATPAPPVGPALGQAQIPVGEFVKRFNDATADKKGLIVPVEISVYADKTFDFIVKSPPAAVLIKKALKIESGSGVPNKQKVGKITRKQLAEIVEAKKDDLNARKVDHAVRIIAGTARSMGVDVVD
ncbi:50S ribosomal protein L11 [Planctomycetales bacterium]|jgi:large subunit ribosomal protein L11|nr:50S ribosomal protein L11 [Planctomycetota bacterium]GHS94992.1 50S ribosomal protein L11 [Planctomycetales bacterium]GHT01717.1 50S ribosomal protein L11 [Planctomycetales bacterium]GHT02681.1 50S ribosomal protein L11 [Planctomycetales bacterium]